MRGMVVRSSALAVLLAGALPAPGGQRARAETALFVRALEIAAGPDGALWFADQDADRVEWIDAAGVVREFAVPTVRSGPSGIATGPEGAVWFTEQNANALGRVDLATGRIREYAIPQLGCDHGHLAREADGALWFVCTYRNLVGRLEPRHARIATQAIGLGCLPCPCVIGAQLQWRR